MRKYCKVKGIWTRAFSQIDMTCRFYRPGSSICQKTEKCEHKTTDPTISFIGKRIASISKKGIVCEDGSVLYLK
jgi:hypothetical protein